MPAKQGKHHADSDTVPKMVSSPIVMAGVASGIQLMWATMAAATNTKQPALAGAASIADLAAGICGAAVATARDEAQPDSVARHSTRTSSTEGMTPSQ